MRALPVVLLLPALARAAPARYALDPDETELLALTRPAGMLKGLSHRHVIRAGAPSGEIVWDAEAPEGSSVAVRFAVEGLEVDDPALRRRLGLDGTLDEGDRKKIAAEMRSREQLDAGRHPGIAFTSTSVRRLEGNRLEVRGKLAIRGVESEVSLPVKVEVIEGALGGEGALEITHAQFGFEPISAALGTIRNAEEIELRLRLVGRAAPPATAQ